MIGLFRIHHFIYRNVLKRPEKKLAVFPKVRSFSEKPLDVNTNVAKDVILFKYDNPRFFKIVNIFAVCQFMFWSYLSVFSFTTLKDAPVDHDQSKETAWWRKINLGENKYRNTLAIMSFIIGLLISFPSQKIKFFICRLRYFDCYMDVYSQIRPLSYPTAGGPKSVFCNIHPLWKK